MNVYYQEALSILKEFPNNEAKESLINLLEYVIKRKQ
jgi:geranylgeranyl pyrophosphate synthase